VGLQWACGPLHAVSAAAREVWAANPGKTLGKPGPNSGSHRPGRVRGSDIGGIFDGNAIGFPTMTQPQPTDASPLSHVEQAVGEFREAASRVQSVLKALTDDERRMPRQKSQYV